MLRNGGKMPERIELAGEWSFGFSEEKMEDVICLPSTTEISRKGDYRPKKGESLYLSRKYPFTGKAYYEREVEIPAHWQGSRAFLFLERTKYTEVFWDGKRVSQSHETLIPQRHMLPEGLKSGTHRLKIMVDNDLASKEDFSESLLAGHQYTEHTQTNWNGIVGELYLEQTKGASLEPPLVLGDWKKGGFWVIFRQAEYITVSGRRSDGEVLPEKRLTGRETYRGTEFFYPLEEVSLWDEFHPVYYSLQIRAADTEGREQVFWQQAGIRELAVCQKRVLLNETPLFLRGTVDCCIYPRTGVCPMDRESWLKIFRTLKDYGMNHCRFHSWCPPEAAFAAADELGMYLQAELSNFANAFYSEENEACDRTLNAYIWEQAKKVLREYGNHPSFLIFAVGNEMTGEIEEYERLIKQLREFRSDRLYTQGANNFLEHPECSREDDCWIMMRTREDCPEGNVRASFSHGDLPLGYLQTKEEPSTLHDYSKGVEKSPLPFISHEIGQYQCYPDFREIKKYDGPLSPENLKLFQERLEAAGMKELGQSFFEASGRLAVQCYREEIEAALRTADMTGFQLLGLQDFPGQGTALVGILDSFLDAKGLIAPEKFRQFCSSQVLLAKFPRYVWQEGQRLEAEILCANYGAADLKLPVQIKLTEKEGRELYSETLSCQADRGGLSRVGRIAVSLPAVSQAKRLTLTLEAGELKNEYELWLYRAYPELLQEQKQGRKLYVKGVLVTDTLDEEAKEALKKGERVLLLTDRIKEEYSVEGFFTPDFWCWPMFRESCEKKGLPVAPGTLGLLCRKEHPALKAFPTESYAQWQWQPILLNSRPVILDAFGDKIRPIVQMIDNFERNHRLGLLFETGSLLFCAGDLLSHLELPQVRQLFESLTEYAASEAFRPEPVLTLREIEELLCTETQASGN